MDMWMVSWRMGMAGEMLILNDPCQGPFPWIPMAGNANYTTVATSRGVVGREVRQAEEGGPLYQVIEL